MQLYEWKEQLIISWTSGKGKKCREEGHNRRVELTLNHGLDLELGEA